MNKNYFSNLFLILVVLLGLQTQAKAEPTLDELNGHWQKIKSTIDMIVKEYKKLESPEFLAGNVSLSPEILASMRKEVKEVVVAVEGSKELESSEIVAGKGSLSPQILALIREEVTVLYTKFEWLRIQMGYIDNIFKTTNPLDEQAAQKVIERLNLLVPKTKEIITSRFPQAAAAFGLVALAEEVSASYYDETSDDRALLTPEEASAH